MVTKSAVYFVTLVIKGHLCHFNKFRFDPLIPRSLLYSYFTDKYICHPPCKKEPLGDIVTISYVIIQMVEQLKFNTLKSHKKYQFKILSVAET